ncbi:hypothetical protein AB4457_25335, partial [Vibrio splendidus]
HTTRKGFYLLSLSFLFSLLKSEDKQERRQISVWQLTKVFGCHQEGLILDNCLPDSIYFLFPLLKK